MLGDRAPRERPGTALGRPPAGLCAPTWGAGGWGNLLGVGSAVQRPVTGGGGDVGLNPAWLPKVPEKPGTHCTDALTVGWWGDSRGTLRVSGTLGGSEVSVSSGQFLRDLGVLGTLRALGALWGSVVSMGSGGFGGAQGMLGAPGFLVSLHVSHKPLCTWLSAFPKPQRPLLLSLSKSMWGDVG